MNEDFRDILALLLDVDARFLVIGAHAMAVYDVPRATGDLDIWIDPESRNAGRVWQALTRFGAPMVDIGVTQADLERPGMVVQIGLPPRRIDVLTGITGVTFEDAWPSRVLHEVGALRVPFIGREDLLRNKKATGRLRDLADVEALEAAGHGGEPR